MNQSVIRNSRHRHGGIWCFFLLFCHLVLIAAGNASASDTVSPRAILTENNYPPYIWADKIGNIRGILADQWRLRQEKTGIRVESGLARIAAEGQEPIDKKGMDSPLPGLLNASLLVDVGLVLMIAGLLYWNWTLRASVKKRAGELASNKRTLRDREAWYLELVDNADFIILRLDLDGRIIYLNECGQRFFGYTLVEIVGRNLVGTIVPPGLPDRRFWEIAADPGEHPSGHALSEDAMVRQDGSPVWVTWSSKVLRGPEGGVREILCVGNDSTDRRLMEEALRQDRERLGCLIAGAGLGTWEWHVQTNEIVISESWAQMLGYTLAELMPCTYATWERLVHPDDVEQTREALLRCAGDEVFDHEFRMRHKDGHWVWIQNRGRVVTCDADGNPLVLIGAHVDISTGKQAEQELVTTNELLTQFIKNSPIYAFIKEVSPTTSRILRVSDNCQDMFGMPVAEILGTTIQELFPAEYVAKMAEDEWRAVSQGDILRFEQEIDGRTYTIIKFPIRQGARGLLAGYAIDITEHRQAQATPLAGEAALHTILQASPMGIHIFDLQPDGRLVLSGANPAADRLLGLEHSRFINKTLEEILPALRETELPMYFRRAAECGESWQAERFEYNYDTVAGIFELYVFQISPGKMAVLFNDASVRKRTEAGRNRQEARLIQVRKMESIGRLAGGVAHDFSNMLVVILGHCELALNGLDASHPLYASLQSVRQAAERSANLTRQLLAFARKQPISPKVLDLNETVAGTLSMLQRLVNEGIDLTWMPGRNVGQVCIDPSQLDQILVNLVANARDAIGDTGKVTIETAALILGEQYCAEHVDMVPGDYLLLAVSDNGCGMDAEKLSLLFEPFFTTKKMGKGTGLGLATVYGIVKQNNGFINVYSEPGQGSTFKVYLPRNVSPADRASAAGAMPAPSGSETVLLVEDEAMILEVATSMLCRLGYTILVASGPDEAIRLAQGHAGAIHLLLTDVVMPEMNGRMLAENLLASNPKLKCLFMSGYTANVIVHHGVLDEGVHFLQKPFTLEALAVKIREVLDEAVC
ncbi:MAG: PAS domain S-box protein [Desulfobulbus sp.]|nr:PAS domain S-box protein [Desulfobulbus sp.]